MLTREGTARAFEDFGSGRVTHMPGLDGIRGIAVLGVICFHGNWPWMRGGFLGVSLFFTLSGFLITSVLLTDHDWNGVSIREFWMRRFRRLLPAAWITLAFVVVASWFLLDASQVESVRLDVFAALGQVANWRFLLVGESYASLFNAPSPVLHFWSLAIEEQFYLVFPIAVLALMSVTRGRRWVLGAVFAAVAALSWAEPFLFGMDLDRVYFGTDTRAGELLAGAVLAVLLAHPGVRRVLARPAWSRTLGVVGFLALMVTLAGWVMIDKGGGFITSGGLPLASTLSVLVILGAVVPNSVVGALCSTSPLLGVGRISYGLYLFHWPLMVFLTESRTGLGHLPRFVLVVSVSFLLAIASFHLIEQPIRRQQGVFGPTRIRPAFLAPIVMLAVIAGLVLMTPEGRPRTAFDFESAAAELQAMRASRVDETTTTTAMAATPASAQMTTTTLPPPPVPRVAAFGDSTMLSLSLVVGGWEQRTRLILGVDGETELGCGIARYGTRREATIIRQRDGCNDWATSWSRKLDRNRPDVAVIAPGQWDLLDHKMRGDDTWRHMGDPAWDEYLRSELLAANDVLASRGALVLWMTVPEFGTVDQERLNENVRRGHDPARVARLNQILREVVAARPENARLIDLGAWMAPRADDVAFREDGVHYNWTDSAAPVGEFVGTEVVRAWQEWWTALQDLALEGNAVNGNQDLAVEVGR